MRRQSGRRCTPTSWPPTAATTIRRLALTWSDRHRSMARRSRHFVATRLRGTSASSATTPLRTSRRAFAPPDRYRLAPNTAGVLVEGAGSRDSPMPYLQAPPRQLRATTATATTARVIFTGRAARRQTTLRLKRRLPHAAYHRSFSDRARVLAAVACFAHVGGRAHQPGLCELMTAPVGPALQPPPGHLRPAAITTKGVHRARPRPQLRRFSRRPRTVARPVPRVAAGGR